MVSVGSCKCQETFYRSPVGDLELFADRMNGLLSYCLTITRYVYFCGDLNIDYMKPFRDRQLIDDILTGFNLKFSVPEGTNRIAVNSATGSVSKSKLEYIVTDGSLSCESYVLQPNPGDHLAVVRLSKV